MKIPCCVTSAVFAIMTATAIGEAPATAKSPPVAIGGYCAVSLITQDAWVKGEAAIYSDYRGDRYLFLSGEEKATFDASPERYAPMLNGNDPVLAISSNTREPGKRDYGMRHKDRNFFFTTNENLLAFQKNPDYYVQQATALQAKDDRLHEREAKLREHEAKRGMTLSEIKAASDTDK